MADDVVLNKCAAVERCVARVRAEYAGDSASLREDLRRQDSILLNLQRACETSIDLAMHVVRRRRLGVPQESRDAFRLLENVSLISVDLSARMMKMVGFRNVAVHDYQRIDLAIVESIVREHLEDFLEFTRQMLASMATDDG